MKSNNGIGIEFNHSYFLFGSVWFEWLSAQLLSVQKVFFQKISHPICDETRKTGNSKRTGYGQSQTKDERDHDEKCRKWEWNIVLAFLVV